MSEKNKDIAELLEYHIKIEKDKLIDKFQSDIDFYLENKKNHNDKFYVYWNEIKKRMGGT